VRSPDSDDVLDDVQPSWPALVAVLSRSFAAPRILEADEEKARSSFRQLDVAASSPLGAIALNCGGILLYDGWLRIFGGSPCYEVGLPSIAQINAFPAQVDRTWTPTEGLIVAHDVLGGVFLLNGLRPGAGRPGVPGELIYFDPRALDWTRMRMSHSEWLSWCVSGELPDFYGRSLWPRWREDVRALRADQGIAVRPELWSDEAPAAEADVTRSAAPMADILHRQFDAAGRRGRHLDGALFRFPIDRPPGR
jgi:hypothetical protein